MRAPVLFTDIGEVEPHTKMVETRRETKQSAHDFVLEHCGAIARHPQFGKALTLTSNGQVLTRRKNESENAFLKRHQNALMGVV